MSSQWLSLLARYRAIAVIRAPNITLGRQMAAAVAAGGMGLIEITWTSLEAAKLVAQLRSELPHCRIGVGTVMTEPDLKDAIAAGAQFCFSPHTDVALLRQAQAQQIPMIPGALTPSEIVTAWQAGASSVKVFPIRAMGGADYIQSLQGPLGHIPLIPTGGVTLENAASLLTAGAVAVGLAGQLFPAAAVASGDWAVVRGQAEKLRQQLNGAAYRQNTP
ncbi:2-dehydro-3-deoxy-phosphogluconate aldolase [Halomicronema hongdechloris C2206]|uniref:2-dehydro-3-deoxy-phosphogluconate aldolase n=1 Tax=Halomicronema hongdechloris C2206 TaxID=1641165 RepID=A0A1Z3HUL1_9CYAN|nr:bifunctional 4-hydroxy-2-oxoglutarate aldolase/2-dehydro-3-deoxy-phosphogluconate aldolase [Halomicronema hongdechloris]ASC74008.1 2-dehydro-3-deoxy-phosphogluconate aldolase [Halomicronema hongdechloris C2206]